MLFVYDSSDGVLVKRDPGSGLGVAPVWVDLVEPTRSEDLLVEQALGVSIPTREEMQEIEASSRIYAEGGAHYMTATILVQEDMPTSVDPPTKRSRREETRLTPIPTATPVTFVLAPKCLVTVRYKEPRAFPIFLARNQKGHQPCHQPSALLVSLLEAIIDREADRVERLQAEVDRLGHGIFEIREGGRARNEQRIRNRRFDRAVREIGREGEVTSRSRETLQSLDRVLTYLALIMGERGEDKFLRQRIKTASRDVAGLTDQVGYLSTKLQFLLDATLGMIGLEQSNIIKFFTVVSVALMPPTLIASVYGMNFKRMPELEWAWGYPMAIGLMIVCSVIPFWWFRRRGWL
jgi:magnesium transporter